jgi:hypothetical protein
MARRSSLHIFDERSKERHVRDRRHSVSLTTAFWVPNADYDRRPGILVLINDADWALEGEAEYELQKDDTIVFLSTLHGG